MPYSRFALMIGLVGSVACGEPPASTLDSGTGESGEVEDSDDSTPSAPSCEPYDGGFPASFSVSMIGFPVVGDEWHESSSFEGSCELSAMSFVHGELDLLLACDHPAPTQPEGAFVGITTDAPGLPSGLAVGATLSVNLREGHHEYGSFASYAVSDDLGLVFGANGHSLSGFFADFDVESFANCDAWVPCGGDEDVTGAIRVKLDEQVLDVFPPESRSISREGQSWQVRVDDARFDAVDCHNGPSGRFAIVRTG